MNLGAGPIVKVGDFLKIADKVHTATDRPQLEKKTALVNIAFVWSKWSFEAPMSEHTINEHSSSELITELLKLIT